MECYAKGKDERITVSKAIEEKIASYMATHHVKHWSNWGLRAESCNGMQDEEYETTYSEMLPENFVVDGDELVGYVYKTEQIFFDGSDKLMIYSWNKSDYGPITSNINEGTVHIVLRQE